MVSRDVAARKIARAAAWLDLAEALLAHPVDEFIANTRDHDLAAFYLMLAIQEVIDLGAHWVADAGWDPPDDASGTFDVLAERGAIDRPLAKALQHAAGLRNLIAHGYARFDHARMHAEAVAELPPQRAFLAPVAAEAGL
jgi:uncharacterized protein YutE (UPF0331/DUF86 family)